MGLFFLVAAFLAPTHLIAQSNKQIAEKYAPIWYQDIDSDNVRADYITSVNYDGDWILNNNWDSFGARALKAYVYWSVVSTETHWFITYTVYHPRDWLEVCLPELCHENDMEGVLLAVRRDGSPYGRLEALESIFHLKVKKYYIPEYLSPKPGLSDVSAGIPISPDGRPLIFIEAKGHGIEIKSSVTQGNGNFPGGDGVVYRYRGIAEEPEAISNGDRDVSYALLPIESELWSRRNSIGNGKVFDDTFRYDGIRCKLTDTIFSGAFDGDNHTSDSAKPPWGWTVSGTAALSRGDFAFDPYLVFKQHFLFNSEIAAEYTENFYNPYNCMKSNPNLPSRRTKPADLEIVVNAAETSLTMQEFPDEVTYRLRLFGKIDKGLAVRRRYKRLFEANINSYSLPLLCGNYKGRYRIKFQFLNKRGKIRRAATRWSKRTKFRVCEEN